MKKKKEKEFECRNGCKEQYVDMVLLCCPKCIKKLGIEVSKEEANQIAKIINNRH